MSARFANVAERVAGWHIAKQRPQDVFGGVFFDLRAKAKEWKEKLSKEAVEHVKKLMVDDLRQRNLDVVSVSFALGKYRGSHFISSAKLAVRTDRERAGKLAEYLLKYSPKYRLKNYEDGVASYNIR